MCWTFLFRFPGFSLPGFFDGFTSLLDFDPSLCSPLSEDDSLLDESLSN